MAGRLASLADHAMRTPVGDEVMLGEARIRVRIAGLSNESFALALTLASVAVACNQSTPVVQAPASQSTAAVIRCRPGTSTARKAIVDFVGRTTKKAHLISCRQPSASPSSTTTARCGRTANVLPARIRAGPDQALAAKHPEWKTTQPFTGAIEGDLRLSSRPVQPG